MLNAVLLTLVILNILNFLLLIKLYESDIRKEVKEEKEDEVKTGDVIKQTESLQGYVATPKSKDEVFSGERRYDPSKIKGAFDDFFVD